MKPNTIILGSISALYLCADLDCKAVSNQSDRCPLCSSHVLSLAGIVNRDTSKIAQTPELVIASNLDEVYP